MRHLTAILLKKPFGKIKSYEKRRALYKRAKKRWINMTWKERTIMHKRINNYGILGATQ